MAGAWTNKGKYRFLDWVLRGTTMPTNFYIYLITNATVPDADTNTLSQVTEIATGNGYTETSLTPGATDFDSITENDTDDRGECQIKDLVWTASGGPIPSSGTGAYYAVLTDDNATEASREILGFFDLTGPVSVSDGQSLTLQNCELRLTTG